MSIPVREILTFTVPLLASDLVYVVMNTMDAVLLEYHGGTSDVAAFRAVQPTARLNQVVLASFALLFTLRRRACLHGVTKKESTTSIGRTLLVAIASFPILPSPFRWPSRSQPYYMEHAMSNLL